MAPSGRTGSLFPPTFPAQIPGPEAALRETPHLIDRSGALGFFARNAEKSLTAEVAKKTREDREARDFLCALCGRSPRSLRLKALRRTANADRKPGSHRYNSIIR